MSGTVCVPPGWKLVPEEPTDEMLAAVWSLRSSNGGHGTLACYEAMLAASPPSPVQAEPVAWRCDGCGRLSADPEGDLHAIRVSGARSCCRERKLLPLYASPPSPAEVEISDEMVERAMREFELVEYDMSSEEYDLAMLEAEKSPLGRKQLQQTRDVMRAALRAALSAGGRP